MAMAFVTLFQHRALPSHSLLAGVLRGRCGCSAKRAVSHCDSARFAVWFGPSRGAMRAMWPGWAAFVIKFYGRLPLFRGLDSVAGAADDGFYVEIFNNQAAFLTDTDCCFTYFHYDLQSLRKRRPARCTHGLGAWPFLAG